MPSFSAEIKNYEIFHVAGGSCTYSYRAYIRLTGVNGGLVGVAYFHRNPSTLPSKDLVKTISVDDVPTTYAQCHYRWEDFANIVDLLRNESPVYITHYGTDYSTIHTSGEPVGEVEG